MVSDLSSCRATLSILSQRSYVFSVLQALDALARFKFDITKRDAALRECFTGTCAERSARRVASDGFTMPFTCFYDHVF